MEPVDDDYLEGHLMPEKDPNSYSGIKWSNKPEPRTRKIIKLEVVPDEEVKDWSSFIEGVALSEGFAASDVSKFLATKERVKIGLNFLTSDEPIEAEWTWTVHVYLNWWEF